MAAITACILFTSTVFAETNHPPASENSTSEISSSEIIVTATRTAETIDETLAPVSVITRKDIERLQATSIAEVLKMTPSVSFTSSGGFGSNQSFSIRGTNSDHVLVLIDGVPVGSSTLGTTAFEHLPITQIEKIEVVRGPRSSLYGSSAIGGIIQIFTRKGGEPETRLSAGYGTDNTREVFVNRSGGNETSSYNMGLNYFASDGYNFVGDYGPDLDDDGYDNYSISISGSHQFTDQFKLSGSFLRTEGTAEYDGYNYIDTRTDSTQQVISAVADYTMNEIWDSQLQLGRSDDKNRNFLHDDPLANPFVDPQTRFNTQRDSVIWKNNISIRDSDLMTLGLDYQKDYVDSTVKYTEDSRWNKAVFAQYLYYGDSLDTQLSFRRDKNQAFGSHNSWNVGVSYPLNESVRVTGTYGTAFKAPTFNDLYWPNDGFFTGNEDLQVEESSSFDFGLDFSTGPAKWTAHYFNTKIDNLIAFQFIPFPGVSTMQNINKAKIDGLELTVSIAWNDWVLSSNLSVINPRDEETGYQLIRRSKRLFNLELDRILDKWSYGASIVAASSRYNDSFENDLIPGYGILNIRAAFKFNNSWTLKAKIDNLFDKEYALSRDFYGRDYKQQGRFFFTSIHYKH
jgi:vitamin B12 transporter